MNKFIKRFTIHNSRFTGAWKIIIIFAVCAVFSAQMMPQANADTSYIVTIDDVIEKRIVTLVYPPTKAKYLKSGCGFFKTGQKVNLSVRGDLNGGNDIIRENNTSRCDVEMAVEYNEKISVSSVFGDSKKAYVTDEGGKLYYISFGDQCSGIFGYRNSNVYIFKNGENLSKGDRLIIPNKKQCSISYSEEQISENKKTETQAKTTNDKIPTDVTGVRAFPKNGGVFLAWSPAKDDNGIAYYVVSYSEYRQSKNATFESMPNRITVKSTHYSFRNLENDRTYYFYVIAVDTAGNKSSFWSSEVSTTPKSSIFVQ